MNSHYIDYDATTDIAHDFLLEPLLAPAQF